MNYEETLDYLYKRLPIFQRVGAAALKPDLSNTIKLLDALGNPHHEFECVHVAGTNGKGTSAHAVSAVMTAAGYKTGLYTSPHLKSFTERIRINGIEVTQQYVIEFIERLTPAIEAINPSFFEVTVAMAFGYFKQQKVDIAIIETGLGGRLDSTNVITPKVCLITMIGWDHANLLGNTLQQIAGEKAGIAKRNVPMVIGADQPELLEVFQAKCQEVSAPLVTAVDYKSEQTSSSVTSQTVTVFYQGKVLYQDLVTDLTANYFNKNIPGVLCTIDQLRTQGWSISEEHIREGFKSIKKTTGLKGRWQIINESPLTIADISHNEPGINALIQQINECKFRRLHLIFGVVKDKELPKILELLPHDANYYFTQSSVPRSLSALDLQNEAKSARLVGESFENVNLAIQFAQKNAHSDDLILICGSTFVVAEIEEL